MPTEINPSIRAVTENPACYSEPRQPPARIELALALRGASTIPMLRSHALVLLVLTALFVPAAGAHTRTRPSTSARALHRDGAVSLPASRRDRRANSAVARAGSRNRADRVSRQQRSKQLARAPKPTRRASRNARIQQPEPQRAHLSRGEIAQLRREHAQPRRERRPAPQLPATGRSATPSDFLDAASAQSQHDRRDQRDRRSDRPDQPDATSPPPRTAAQPVGVVSVIRRSGDHPQLEPLSEAATAPLVLPQLPNDRIHHGVYAPLYGSHEILVHQNLMADRDGLDRILNDDDLLDKRRDRQLVPIPESAALRIDDRLPLNRRFCRPWVAQFLNEMAQAHFARFHTPLQVNSAVRTVEFQHQLIHRNGNAAPAEGDTASPHLTGQAVDIAKRWMPVAEISWLRGYLLPLIENGRVDVEEEFQQSCFHISAYRTGTPLPTPGSTGRYIAETPGIPAASAWSAATR